MATEKLYKISVNHTLETPTLSGEAVVIDNGGMSWVEMHQVDAVEVSRLGKLGRLMMPYRGCGRGRMGPRGDGGITELDPIEDVEGDRWVPVLEEDLNLLKAKAVEVVHGRWETANDGTHFCPHCGCDAPYTWDDIDRNFINSADDVPDRPSNYCPNCGAKMDGDGNE